MTVQTNLAIVGDPVNHPIHYTSSKAKCSKCKEKIECIDVIKHLDLPIGSAIKYLWRFEKKGGIQDLQKAIAYIQIKIAELEK